MMHGLGRDTLGADTCGAMGHDTLGYETLACETLGYDAAEGVASKDAADLVAGEAYRLAA